MLVALLGLCVHCDPWWGASSAQRAGCKCEHRGVWGPQHPVEAMAALVPRPGDLEGTSLPSWYLRWLSCPMEGRDPSWRGPVTVTPGGQEQLSPLGDTREAPLGTSRLPCPHWGAAPEATQSALPSSPLHPGPSPRSPQWPVPNIRAVNAAPVSRVCGWLCSSHLLGQEPRGSHRALPTGVGTRSLLGRGWVLLSVSGRGQSSWGF